ncbi:unnamed protein product [Psylliodes chrysocephalus]|uniref:Peptidase S1 domain-containing protein n=1 Tax=Psylliodes chrysocephalus TaxID=3402493 RepID=A0A9P0D507_9CUCU|nr:unnamed protein product [Psylliodes chrysocephala]
MHEKFKNFTNPLKDDIAVLKTGYIQSKLLKKVDMTIIDNKICEEIWKDTDNPVDTEKEICAQADMSDGKKRGPCYGDSGSPLVIDGVQYGIISSFHNGCGIAEYPIVYTRVAHYIDWLSDKI